MCCIIIIRMWEWGGGKERIERDTVHTERSNRCFYTITSPLEFFSSGKLCASHFPSHKENRRQLDGLSSAIWWKKYFFRNICSWKLRHSTVTFRSLFSALTRDYCEESEEIETNSRKLLCITSVTVETEKHTSKKKTEREDEERGKKISRMKTKFEHEVCMKMFEKCVFPSLFSCFALFQRLKSMV